MDDTSKLQFFKFLASTENGRYLVKDSSIVEDIGNFKVADSVYICSLFSNTQFIGKQNGSKLQYYNRK